MAKTFEELAKQVEEGKSGLNSVDDLMALFADEAPAGNQPQPTPSPVVAAPAPSTAEAPTPQSTPPVVPAGQGEPNEELLKRVPDKFRDKDIPSSLEKTVKSYLELEQDNTRTKEELLRLRELVENLSKSTPQPQATPRAQAEPQPMADDFADIDDVAVLEKPKDIILKMIDKRAAQIAAAAVGQYHQMQVDQLTRTQMIERFKAQHPDFDNYVDDMRAVIQLRPDLNQRTDSLPTIYELGKQRYQKRIEAMKVQLGVDKPAQTTLTEEMKQSLLAEATEKAKREILEEVRKRRAASGTLPAGSTPNTLQSRTEEKPKERALTEDEKVFDEMLNSGPNKPGWEK